MIAAPVQLRVERSLGPLGAEWDPLFDAGVGLQTSRPWFDASARAALPEGAAPAYVAVTGPDGPLALFPMIAGPGRAWGSLTTPYTCVYQPLLRPGADPGQLRAACVAFARHCRQWPITRLEALDADWPGLPVLRRAFATAGLPSRTFTHFANWHEAIPGGWAAYRDSRPGALRETIRRRTRAAERGGIRTEIVRAGPHLPAALAAYEAVYARSWKEPEPFPDFNRALVLGLADAGVLRIALMWDGETPIAAQYWSVNGRCGTVLKLAHDDRHKALSPGTVLTAAAITALIETDGVTELDFGRGDDPYKRAWAGERRLRIGLLALNPATVAGLGTLLRHDVGRVRRFARQCLRAPRAVEAGI